MTLVTERLPAVLGAGPCELRFDAGSSLGRDHSAAKI
jgi:hypothetical protein